MIIEVNSVEQMLAFGQKIGRLLRGGMTVELVGDIGAGKTTLVKGIAVGLGIDETVQSPTFTINQMYHGRDGIMLAHYDFYRLESAGIMLDEISETLHDPQAVTIVEWAGPVNGVLPDDRVTITLTSPTEESRHLELHAGGVHSQQFLEAIK